MVAETFLLVSNLSLDLGCSLDAQVRHDQHGEPSASYTGSSLYWAVIVG